MSCENLAAASSLDRSRRSLCWTYSTAPWDKEVVGRRKYFPHSGDLVDPWDATAGHEGEEGQEQVATGSQDVEGFAAKVDESVEPGQEWRRRNGR